MRLAQQGGMVGKGKGKQKAMQVSLDYGHAHHDSMYTDRRTRAGGENRRQPRSLKKWAGALGGMSWADDQEKADQSVDGQ